MPRRGARQQQVRDVRAADEQHERHGAKEDQQAVADAERRLVAKRNEAQGGPAVEVRESLLEVGGDGRELPLRLRDVDTGAQPPDDA